MLRDYMKLLRVKHYIKNLLVFMPMFFSGMIFDREKIVRGGGGICLLLFFIISGLYFERLPRFRKR